MADFELPGYELYERLGRGGMASVYRALHLNLDREVAIKVMDPAMSADENFSERFIREARISARLTHPSILQIYDVNTFDGMNYIAMEYLPMGDLADIIYTGIPQSTIYEVMRQMTEALDYAAGQGYVHRDIKPSNIMLRARDDYVLADFGIARAANSGTQMTQTGLMVGTPSYMSPEQAKGLEVDGRSDLYALAVLWYEMMVKELPYDSDSAVTTAVKHLTEAIPTLPDHLSAYQDFLNKAMAKDPAERFQTGDEMYRALREASTGFSDDQILTEAREPPRPATTGEPASVPDGTVVSSESGTAVAWNTDQTQVSGASFRATGGGSGARPYKLEGTAQRERLVSGMYKDKESKSGGGRFLWLALLLVALGGGGYYGYNFWMDQQSATQRGLRSLTGEMASAYKSLEAGELAAAAASFNTVLSSDPGNNAASQGLRDVEMRFAEAVNEALAAGDIDAASEQLAALLESLPGARQASGLQQSVAEAQEAAAAAESERLAQAEAEKARAEAEQAMNELLDRAAAAMAAVKQDPAQGEQAAALFREAQAQDPDSSRAADGLTALENYYVDAGQEAASQGEFDSASALVSQGLALFPEQAQLAALQKNLPALEETWEAEAEARAAEQARIAAAEAEAAQAREEANSDANEALLAITDGDLDSARETYEELLEDYPDLDATRSLGQKLVAAYIATTRSQLGDEDYDGAESTLEDGRSLAPDKAEWIELETELDDARSSSRRRLGAF